MRIAVYGGAGMIGSRIVAEALFRDHRVTVITRKPPGDLPAGAAARIGDAADGDDVAKVSSGNDVIVSAIGPSRTGGRAEAFLTALRRLAENVGSHRLVVVGGSGVLHVASGLRLLDTPDFPPTYRHEALAQLAALEQLKDGGGFVDWVYISPAPITMPGERTGHYTLSSGTLLNHSISAEDYAVATVDEIERPRHRRQHIAVSS